MHHRYSKYSDEWLVGLYLESRSVDGMYKSESELPFSPAEIHRRLRKMGIVRSAGRHTDFWESVEFFNFSNNSKSSFERILKDLPKVQASLVSLHRIGKRIKDGVFVRRATALFVENDGRLLLGREEGLLTIPMTYSRIIEPTVDSITRVLQQEVLSFEAINGSFARYGFYEKTVKNVEKVFDFGVLDVLVSCYKLNISGLTPSSIRLKDLNYYQGEVLALEDKFRPGVKELASYFLNNHRSNRIVISSLNATLIKMEPNC